MPSIEGTIHADDGQAVRFHLSADGSWRGWGATRDARDEAAPLVSAMTEGLLAHSSYYQQEEQHPANDEDAYQPPTADEDILPAAPPLVIPETEEQDEEEALYPYPAPEAIAPDPKDVAAHALASLYARWDGLDLATGCTKSQVNGYMIRANDAIFRDARQHSGSVATA